MANKPTEITKPLESSELIARIALTGNLAPLSDEQRWEYYQAYCRHLGLDPITRPFDILTRTEKDGSKIVTLYANASCSSQIADGRGVTYGKPEIEYSEVIGTLTVWVLGELPNGRKQWNCGVVHIQALGGKALENAIKKATTQAHRRVTLALCGISMPDESEIVDIEGAQTATLKTPQHVTLGSSPMSVEDHIKQLLREAGSTDNEVTTNYVIEWLKRGAYQQIARQLKCNADDLAHKFGYLRDEAEAAQIGYTAENRAHNAEAAMRLDTAIKRLTDAKMKHQAIRNEINSIVKREDTDIIETRYELTDDEVAQVCEAFEAWAKKLESKAAKKAEA